MSASATIGLIKEAIGIVEKFNLPKRVVDSLATADSYLNGENPYPRQTFSLIILLF